METIKTLNQDLGELGYSVWFDQAITGGQHWWDHILNNIRECEIFVIALTPELLESEACREELNYACKLGKSILPVLLSDEVNVSRLPSPLRDILYMDYRQQDKDAFKRLRKAIQNLPSPRQLPDPLPEPPPAPFSYLSFLREQIETVKNLSFGEQAAIVLNVKKRLADRDSPVEFVEIRDLLHRLRQRDDLLAKTADEIDALIARIEEKRVASGPPPKSSPQAKTIPETIKTRSEEAAEQVEKAHPTELGRLAERTHKPSNPIVKGMKQYKIFQHPSGMVKAVKQGWSWPAFFFNIMWALFKRMWVLGGSLFAIFFVLGLISGAAGRDADAIDAITAIANIIVAIVFGVNGNSWTERNLQSTGYGFKTTVTAANPEGAMALYLKEKHEQ